MTPPARAAETRAHAAAGSQPSSIEVPGAAVDAVSTVPHDVTFSVYAESFWLPHHVIEAVTRQTYIYVLHRHLIPTFGGMPLTAITASDVRAWVASQQAKGVKPATLLHNEPYRG
ncbi:hypothetical protein KDK95_17820 [Actinospica sp. MGRD01-02]|uniref:Core-binding (CB) domain-containing protein n=1 Tax=Actinospica acidithermotolerans TaxID=2828514 RepID=A0A941IH61_9ACTN|nr:hypothetical protein [Actinospica acidithermotolerans]MBR7828180.1 hypothetical protein [Actinospica acidithermotolerans]